MLEKEGQVSIEYLIMVGFVIFLIIGILGVSLFYSGVINDNIRMNYLKNYANKIISSSESVFYAGEPSLATINAYLPPGVEGIGISGKDILVNISTGSGVTRIAFSSNVPINGTLSRNEGVKRIKITARASDVLISEG